MSSAPRRGLTIDDPVGAATTPRAAVHPTAAPTLGGITNSRLRDIPLEQIEPNPHQPRKRFDDASLSSLADSIRERGVIQPVIVRPRATGGFELVAGERRWRAAQIAGQSDIPALVDTHLDGPQSLELALIENLARDDLTPIEEARTIVLLLDDLKVTATRLAKRLGRSRTDLAHTVRLLDLPDQAIDLIDTGTLTKGHGKALLTEPDHQRRLALARRAAEAGWSVRRLEAEIARPGHRSPPRPEPHPDAAAAATRLEETIEKATGCQATARPHHHGYQLILNQDAAQRLIELLDASARQA